MFKVVLGQRGQLGTWNIVYSRLSDMCNMRIVDIQYTITVIVYCIVYGRSCDTYTFHLNGPYKG